MFEPYLTDENLQELCNYKYTAGEYTHLDNFLNKKFWTPLVEYIPTWIAPNVITLAGFISSLIAALLLFVYDPEFIGAQPSYVSVLIALCLFAYQTFDALDGKQARRTNMANSLGTLFDHGCDVVTTSFLVLVFISNSGMGITRYTMANLVITHLCQFICIWYEYYFHFFMASNNKWFGVTEIQCLAALGMILHALTGNSMVGSFMPPIFAVYETVYCLIYIVDGIKTLSKQQRSDERDPNVKLRRAISQISFFVPYVLIEWLFLCVAVIDGDMHFLIGLWVVVLANSIACIRFILASCSSRLFHTIQWPLIPFLILTIVLEFGHLIGVKRFYYYSINHLNTVGLAVLLFECAYFWDLVTKSINGMANILEINVFSFREKKD